MSIEKSIVSRDDRFYEGFPDVAATPSGRLVCVYRESDEHRPVAVANLVWRTSDDSGRTWGPRRLLAQAVRRGDKLIVGDGPRIVCLQDGRLIYIAGDFEVPCEGRQPSRNSRVHFWVSKDVADLNSISTGRGQDVRPVPVAKQCPSGKRATGKNF